MLKPVATLTLAFAGLLTTAALAHAQTATATRPGFELLVPSGTVASIGAPEGGTKRANLTAVQLSYGLGPEVVVTSTVGWARTTTLADGARAKLDLFTYDAGLEYRLPRRSTDRRVNFKPFTGFGFGARMQSSRSGDAAAAHDMAAYASGGGELGLARVRVRIELRDYLTWAAPFGATAATRNHVTAMAGVRLALRSPR